MKTDNQTVLWKDFENLEDVIDFWNHLPKTIKHNCDPSFQQARDIDQQLNKLCNGNYIQTKNDGDPYKRLTDFFKINNIPGHLHTKKWTIDEIKDVLKFIQNTSYVKEKRDLRKTFWDKFNGYSSFYLHAQEALSGTKKLKRKRIPISRSVAIVEKDGQRYVNARDLHKFLGSKRDFSNWIKRRIDKYNLCEGQDFVLNKLVEAKTVGLQPKIDYNLTVDTAKSLSMVESNYKGAQIRKYFIDCEVQLWANFKQESADNDMAQTQKRLELEDQIKELQTKTHDQKVNPENDLINNSLKRIEENTALLLELQAPQVTVQPVITIQEVKAIEPSKTCPRCGIEKPLSYYSKDKWNKNGHRSYCKECDKKRIKKYRLKVKALKKIKVEPVKQVPKNKKGLYRKIVNYLSG